MNEQHCEIKYTLEAGLMAAGEPLSLERLSHLFLETERPTNAELKQALNELAEDYAQRSIELKELASGYCFRVKEFFSPWIARLWAERPARYSRALMETLALIAYRQPITRGEIEKVRGVSVNTSIIKTLQDRAWIRIVGHRDIPGKPSLYATTKEFLDYFSLQSLEDLPPLVEIKDLEQVGEQLEDSMANEISMPVAELLNPTHIAESFEEN